MSGAAWHPDDEGMAASALAAFVEWLRATGRCADADPDGVLAWAAARGAGFDAAMAGFMGWRWPPAPGSAGRLPAAVAALHAARGSREAVVRIGAGGRRAWTYDALPGDLIARLAGADLVGLAAFHLFRANTRPDDRILWIGVPDDVRPLGALLVGATVILADAPSAALAAAEGARELRPPP